jgi:hypothetical protein
MEEQIEFIIVPNTEDPEIGGYFAYEQYDYDQMMLAGGYGALGPTKGPFPTRGYGETKEEAVVCLLAIMDEGNNNRSVEWHRSFLYQPIKPYENKITFTNSQKKFIDHVPNIVALEQLRTGRILCVDELNRYHPFYVLLTTGEIRNIHNFYKVWRDNNEPDNDNEV